MEEYVSVPTEPYNSGSERAKSTSQEITGSCFRIVEGLKLFPVCEDGRHLLAHISCIFGSGQSCHLESSVETLRLLGASDLYSGSSQLDSQPS
jgi:hypothetical protein